MKRRRSTRVMIIGALAGAGAAVACGTHRENTGGEQSDLVAQCPITAEASQATTDYRPLIVAQAATATLTADSAPPTDACDAPSDVGYDIDADPDVPDPNANLLFTGGVRPDYFTLNNATRDSDSFNTLFAMTTYVLEDLDGAVDNPDWAAAYLVTSVGNLIEIKLSGRRPDGSRVSSSAITAIHPSSVTALVVSDAVNGLTTVSPADPTVGTRLEDLNNAICGFTIASGSIPVDVTGEGTIAMDFQIRLLNGQSLIDGALALLAGQAPPIGAATRTDSIASGGRYPYKGGAGPAYGTFHTYAYSGGGITIQDKQKPGTRPKPSPRPKKPVKPPGGGGGGGSGGTTPPCKTNPPSGGGPITTPPAKDKCIDATSEAQCAGGCQKYQANAGVCVTGSLKGEVHCQVNIPLKPVDIGGSLECSLCATVNVCSVMSPVDGVCGWVDKTENGVHLKGCKCVFQ